MQHPSVFSSKALLVLKIKCKRSNSQDILRFSSTCIYLPLIASITNLIINRAVENVCYSFLRIQVTVFLLLQYCRQLLSKAVLMMKETIRHLAFKHVLICLRLEYISYSAVTA